MDINTQGSIMDALGIEVMEVEAERVVCTMPVNEKTRQPFGVLHGGASLVLAETAASIGSYAQINQDTQIAVGMEINANHLRSVADGTVTATATPLHKGRTSMVWEIKITDDKERLICVSRCTIAIIDKRS